MKKVGGILLALLLFAAGCAGPVSSASSAPSSTGSASSVPASAVASSQAPVSAAAQAAPPPPTGTPASSQGAEAPAAGPETAFDQTDFEDFLERFVDFFKAEVPRVDELDRGSRFSYYLLNETFTRLKDGGLTQDEEWFWQLPIPEVEATAEAVFGFENFSIDTITAWPFRWPGDTYCLFTLETEPPLCARTYSFDRV